MQSRTRKRMERDASSPGGSRSFRQKTLTLLTAVALVLLLAAVAVPLAAVVTTPLTLTWQAFNAVAMIIAAIVLARIRNRTWAMVLVFASVLASTRYMYWRITATLPVGPEHGLLDLTLAIGLLAAECYAYTILLLGFFQTVWPLKRKPVPLPMDFRTWPEVDVFIPTYNEPLDVVRATVLAARDMDWPKDKLNVYLLDDGRREEFRAFCEQWDVGYITRQDNKHAKAGNINAALGSTSGAYVTIFDCDHIPTRSFLQMTMGVMVANPRMGLVQAPHHFFSADPFERNLKTFRDVPNEGELFYGLVQDGNDFWNATFFCGSCAVIRREALEEIGGIATETVTEDAHTSLRMHARGWESAYLRIPQAAGLATESLSAHVGQRVRWARGMAQIFRIDNPLLKARLSLGQRLCYTNAMLHFFYALPRIIFLTSPLAYLLLGAQIINAQGLMVLAYAAPHLVIANIANSTIQGEHRQSFWSEVYETVLATYILLPTLLALINPKLGSFNVTAKGGMVEQDYFDFRIAKPYVALFALNLFAFSVGVLTVVLGWQYVLDTLLLNMGWSAYNMIILGASLAVAHEGAQRRRAHRVVRSMAAVLNAQGSKLHHKAETVDLSYGGALLRIQEADEFTPGSRVRMAVDAKHPSWIDGRVVRRLDSGEVSVEFDPLRPAAERALVSAIFGQSNAWMAWRREGARRDRPLKALATICRASFSGLGALLKWLFNRRFRSASSRGHDNDKARKKSMRMPDTSPTPASIMIAAASLALLAGILLPAPVGAAESGNDARPEEGAELESMKMETALLEGVSSEEAGPSAMRTDLSFRQRRHSYTFEDFGASSGLLLRTVRGHASIPLNVRQDRVVTSARLRLRMTYSPALRYEFSHLNVLVNDEIVHTVPLAAERANGHVVDVDIEPRILLPNNRITFEGILHYAPPNECEDPTHSSLWLQLASDSTLNVEYDYLGGGYRFEDLPIPFFDPGDPRRLTLPFAFAGSPSAEVRKAASMMSSWFGAAADYRGAVFPVRYGELPPGHGVVMLVGDQAVPGLGTDVPERREGNRAAVVPHPDVPGAFLLVMWGATEGDLVTLARGIALGDGALDGASASVASVNPPSSRQPWDGARWVNPADGDYLITEGASGRTTVWGLAPEPARFEFSLPPDLYPLEDDSVALDLEYRVTPIAADRSAVNTSFNQEFVGGVGLFFEGEQVASEEATGRMTASIPHDLLSARNRIDTQFHLRRNTQRVCEDFDPFAMKGAVAPSSRLRFSNYAHFVEMPDLSKFARGGYPYSRMGDLRETVLLTAARPEANQMAAALTLVGHVARWTGEPATQIASANLSSASAWVGHDLLVVAPDDAAMLPEALRENSAVRFTGDGVRVRRVTRLEALRGRLIGKDRERAYEVASEVAVDSGRNIGALLQFASPYGADRTVTMAASGAGASAMRVAESVVDPGKAQYIRGGVALDSGGEISGYDLGDEYTQGKLPFREVLKRWFERHPYLLFVVGLVLVALIAFLVIKLLHRVAKRRAKD